MAPHADLPRQIAQTQTLETLEKGILKRDQNGKYYYSILGLYGDNGKENGNYYNYYISLLRGFGAAPAASGDPQPAHGLEIDCSEF